MRSPTSSRPYANTSAHFFLIFKNVFHFQPDTLTWYGGTTAAVTPARRAERNRKMERAKACL